MRTLLDTNVLSEAVRPRPSPAVAAWFQSVPSDDQFLSVLSVGELRYGALKLKEGVQKTRLTEWIENDILGAKASGILPVNQAVIERWAQLRAITPRTLPAIDGLIAATALAHGLALATRNVRDFEGLGLRLVDPFAFGAGG